MILKYLRKDKGWVFLDGVEKIEYHWIGKVPKTDIGFFGSGKEYKHGFNYVLENEKLMSNDNIAHISGWAFILGFTESKKSDKFYRGPGNSYYLFLPAIYVDQCYLCNDDGQTIERLY